MLQEVKPFSSKVTILCDLINSWDNIVLSFLNNYDLGGDEKTDTSIEIKTFIVFYCGSSGYPYDKTMW